MSSTWRWISRRAIEAMPLDHAARRHLRLIEQALRSDLHFLARHPTALFQCLWNRCWWYDCPAAAAHHDPPPGGWPADGPPWSRPGDDRLATLLESWRAAKQRRTPAFTWLRSLRPPPFPLGGAELACLRGHDDFGLRAWRSTGRVGGSSAGRTTGRCGSGTRPPAPSWPASAGTTTGSRAWRSTGRGGGSSAGRATTTVRVWDAASGAALACLRGHDGLCHERGVRQGGAADRQRVARQDGAGVGRGLRRRAGLPPRARQARSRAWRSTGRVGGSSAGRGTRRCGCGTRPPAPRWPASAGTTRGS